MANRCAPRYKTASRRSNWPKRPPLHGAKNASSLCRSTGMNNTPLRIGVVGLGRLGQRHAQNLVQRVPNAEVVAACSPVADELAWARAALHIQHCYADYTELLAHPGLDAVF